MQKVLSLCWFVIVPLIPTATDFVNIILRMVPLLDRSPKLAFVDAS